VHLIGFFIELYYDALPYKGQTLHATVFLPWCYRPLVFLLLHFMYELWTRAYWSQTVIYMSS